MHSVLRQKVYPNLHHVGVVVRDIDQAGKDNAKRFGFGAVAWQTTLRFENALYRGRRITYSAEFGFIELGNSSIELIQPIGEHASPYLDALTERGENTHHLAYMVPSIDRHLEEARQAGASPVLVVDANLPGGLGRIVYVEGLVHGVLIELLELLPQLK